MGMRKIGLYSLVFLLNMSVITAQYKEKDWDNRDSWMNVQHIFDLAGIESGDSVADLGCHEGYISFHLSKRVGDQGNVLAIDVREDRLETLNTIAKRKGTTNIETILGEYDNPHLAKKSVDVVLLIDVFHEIRNYKKVLSHLKEALKPNGRILILEKLKSEIIGKSRAEQTAAHSLSEGYVREDLTEAGFVELKSYTNLGYWENNKEKEIWIMVGNLPSS